MPAWVAVVATVAIFLAGAAVGFAFRTTVQIGDIKKDIAVLQTNDEVFWRVVGPHMSGIALSPEHLERDHLIRKLDEETVTYDDLLSLNSILGHDLEEESDPMKKVALAFKLAQVRQLLTKADARKPKG